MMPNGDGTGDKINLGQLLNFNMREYARNLSAIPTQSEVDGKLVFHVPVDTVQISDILSWQGQQTGHASSISEVCTVSVYSVLTVFVSIVQLSCGCRRVDEMLDAAVTVKVTLGLVFWKQSPFT